MKNRRGSAGTTGFKYLRESRNAQIIWRDLYYLEKSVRGLINSDNYIDEPHLLSWDTVLDNDYFKILKIPEFAMKQMFDKPLPQSPQTNSESST